MEKYQSIPRKFRPQRFSDVVGQEETVTTLKNALRLGKGAQAYLFCGLRGTGKTTLARLFAKALCCASPQETEPCNACESCKEIQAGCSLDVIEIDGASNRGIDDVRSLNETIGYAPAKGYYKIYIIDEVHMLTKEAFNALLKTLEEPPAHVKFFFATTEPHKVLPTIISRCQRFDLKRIPNEKICAKLALITEKNGREIEKEALGAIAKYAEGSLRDAESLLDQMLCYETDKITSGHVYQMLGLFEGDLFFELDEAIQKGEEAEALQLAEKIFNSGKDPAHFIDQCIDHFRAHLALKHNLSTEDSEKRRQLAQGYTKEQCSFLMEILCRAYENSIKFPFKRIHMEMLFFQMIRSSKRIPIEQVAKKLLDLEKNLQEKRPEPSLPQEVPVVIKEIKEPLKPAEPPPPKPLPAPAASETKLSDNEEIRHENLLRFAAVELNGTVKK